MDLELAQKREEKRQWLREANAKLNELCERSEKLATEVDSGEEIRPVECYESWDYENKSVEFIREDTGEPAEGQGRPMTAKEIEEAKQRGFFDENVGPLATASAEEETAEVH